MIFLCFSFISLLSLTKGMAEYQVTNRFKEESDIFKTIKCRAFILPQTVVRVLSFALILAFLKYYATIPAAVCITTSIIIAIVSAEKYPIRINYMPDGNWPVPETGNDMLFATVLAGICVPFTSEPRNPSHRLYLKLSMLTTNIYLLICLLVIYFLPHITPPETLIQRKAFQHLNFNISGVYF